MIPVGNLLDQFELMLREHWSYIWGAAETGCVDCSGAFVYVFRKHGEKIYHGSNTIARHYIAGKLLPISEAKPGYAAFKVRPSGGEPEKYRCDGIGDVYHIGLVGRDINVLNAKSEKAGFCSDPLSSGWKWCAPLKNVLYVGGEPVTMNTATVNTGGGSLNVRKGPGKNNPLVERIPDGSTVEILGGNGDWLQICCGKVSGWVLAEYITRQQASTDQEPKEPMTLEERVAALEAAVFGETHAGN